MNISGTQSLQLTVLVGSEEPVNGLGDAETGPARMAAARSPITDGYLHLMASSLPVGLLPEVRQLRAGRCSSVRRAGLGPPLLPVRGEAGAHCLAMRLARRGRRTGAGVDQFSSS